MIKIFKKGLSTKDKQGFTLIELLVVVAVVGVLSGIVVSIVRTGGNKSDDLAIKSNLNEALIHAKLFYEKYGYYHSNNAILVVKNNDYLGYSGTIFSYGTPQVTDASDSIFRFMWNAQFITNASATPGSLPDITYGTGSPYVDNGSGGVSSNSYAVAAPLKTQNIISSSSGTDYFCIDSSLEEGKVIDTTAQMTGDTGVGTGPTYNGVASCG